MRLRCNPVSLPAIMLAGFTAYAAPAFCALYRCAAPGGAETVRDTPGPGCMRLVATAPGGLNIDPVYVQPDYRRPLPAPATLRGKLASALREQLASHALAEGVPEDLVYLMIEQESRFNPLAVSRRGALGLMQLMPDTARALGVENPWDAAQNLRGGVRYLGRMLRRFEGSVPLAVAAYNAGPGAVERAGNRVPGINETRDYVSNIVRSFANGRHVPELERLMDGGRSRRTRTTATGGVVVIDNRPEAAGRGVTIGSTPAAAGKPGSTLYVWVDAQGVEQTTNYKPVNGRIIKIISP